MTRKDFELIAKLVREGLDRAEGAATVQQMEGERGALHRFADNFAMEAAVANPGFLRSRFMTACGFRLNAGTWA